MRIAGTLLPLALLMAAVPAAAGPWDYWVLSYSWTPEYCRAYVSSHETQCVDEHYFVIDGLKHHVSGPDEACKSHETVPKELVDRMLPLLYNATTIGATWKQAGACSGLPMKEYFLQLERVSRLVTAPSRFSNLQDDAETSPSELKSAFAAVNEGLTPQGVILDCGGRWLKQVRICLDSEFAFRDCGLDLPDDCPADMRIRGVTGKFRRPQY